MAYNVTSICLIHCKILFWTEDNILKSDKLYSVHIQYTEYRVWNSFVLFMTCFCFIYEFFYVYIMYKMCCTTLKSRAFWRFKLYQSFKSDQLGDSKTCFLEDTFLSSFETYKDNTDFRFSPKLQAFKKALSLIGHRIHAQDKLGGCEKIPLKKTTIFVYLGTDIICS